LLILLPSLLTGARAQDIRVLWSAPEASAWIDGRTSEFCVRFNVPIDHVHSMLFIMREETVVETLHPRLESAPEVLFARAPTLSPGDYVLRWSVRSMTGVDLTRGDIPFAVK
jgi:methionine-rich copper-binding protein CopC